MLLHSLAAVLLGAAGRAELFLEADVAALSERARHALRRHWEGNPRARKPRFLVNDEMLASMPLLREGLCRFEGRFRAARPPRRRAGAARLASFSSATARCGTCSTRCASR